MKWASLIAGLMLWSFIIFSIWNAITIGTRIYTWSNTQGTVINSDLEKCDKNERGRSLAAINYRYSINNSTYVGNRIEPYLASPACEESSLFGDDAREALADKYRTNANILVYFNSQQPNDSFILGDKGIWHYFKLIITICMMSFFAFVLVFIFFVKDEKVDSKEE